MGKAKRHEKIQNKQRPTKPQAQAIKRRQHSQNGKLSRPRKADVAQKPSSKDVKQPIKLRVPFTRFDRVLLVGEGDFSFALSLARHHQVGAIVATSFDDESTLKAKYPFVGETLKSLQESGQAKSVDDQKHAKPDDEWNGFSSTSESNDEQDLNEGELRSTNATIIHGIDATALSKVHKKALNPHAPFTKIVFNFPHTGGLSTDVNRQVRANQELLVNFFNAAKPLLATKSHPAQKIVEDKPDNENYDEYDEYDENGELNDQDETARQILSIGQILVTLFEGEPYTLWNIRDLARHCGLQVIESFKFPWAAYPGYKHARTVGDIVTGKDRSDEGKRKGAWRGEERDARCYVLGLKGDVSSRGGKKRKRGNDDSDESE